VSRTLNEELHNRILELKESRKPLSVDGETVIEMSKRINDAVELALASVIRYVREARVAKATESVPFDASLTHLDKPVSFLDTRSTNLEGLAGLVGSTEPHDRVPNLP
jgi:hypothetical protein